MRDAARSAGSPLRPRETTFKLAPVTLPLHKPKCFRWKDEPRLARTPIDRRENIRADAARVRAAKLGDFSKLVKLFSDVRRTYGITAMRNLDKAESAV